MIKKLRSLYNSPNDVDLVIGGMAERSTGDGILGPVFQCLVAEQMARSRRADRFFYDSAKQAYPFTSGKKTFFYSYYFILLREK